MWDGSISDLTHTHTFLAILSIPDETKNKKIYHSIIGKREQKDKNIPNTMKNEGKNFSMTSSTLVNFKPRNFY